jgi:hypothetical protein
MILILVENTENSLFRRHLLIVENLYNLVIQITDVIIGLPVQGENWGNRMLNLISTTNLHNMYHFL